MLTPEQIKEFQITLEKRYRELLEEIHQALLQSDEERFQKLAGEVHDMEELSVADLLVDLNYAEIDHLLDELREVEDALRRIRPTQPPSVPPRPRRSMKKPMPAAPIQRCKPLIC